MKKFLTKKDEDFYGWLIEARAKAQTLMLDLATCSNSQCETSEKNRWSLEQEKLYNSLVGIAFSLWRAAPLVNK